MDVRVTGAIGAVGTAVTDRLGREVAFPDDREGCDVVGEESPDGTGRSVDAGRERGERCSEA